MPLARFNLRHHFVLLACAVVIIAAMAHLALFGVASLLPNAAIYGGLHAAALTGALRSTAPALRKFLFVLSAAVLNAAVLYAGILGLALLGATALRLFRLEVSDVDIDDARHVHRHRGRAKQRH